MNDAAQALQEFLKTPAMQNAVNGLSELKKTFDEEISYYKGFRYSKDKPSDLPVKRVQKIVFDSEELKKLILEFKKEFNENELPENLRSVFIKMFIILTADSLPIRDSEVFLGGELGAWFKGVDHILNVWESLQYQIKVEYSKQAYKYIEKRFELLSLVKALEEKVIF